MKGMLMAILFALAAACGGSNSGSGGSTGTTNPNNFLGTAWTSSRRSGHEIPRYVSSKRLGLSDFQRAISSACRAS